MDSQEALRNSLRGEGGDTMDHLHSVYIQVTPRLQQVSCATLQKSHQKNMIHLEGFTWVLESQITSAERIHLGLVQPLFCRWENWVPERMSTALYNINNPHLEAGFPRWRNICKTSKYIEQAQLAGCYLRAEFIFLSPTVPVYLFHSGSSFLTSEGKKYIYF